MMMLLVELLMRSLAASKRKKKCSEPFADELKERNRLPIDQNGMGKKNKTKTD